MSLGCGRGTGYDARYGGPGLQQVSRLFGRDAECAAIDRLLEDARAGAGGAVVIRGEAGIGKSALLDYARRHAAPMAVLFACGVEAESDLAFAGVHELLRPLLNYLGELPDIQSRALAGALGLAPSTRADRLLISAGVLGVLAAAAESSPTLVLVDDAQWLDRPSADALMFTARRLRAERLAILFAAREGEATRFGAAGLAELMLAGLADEPAAAVLATQACQAPPATGCWPRRRGICWRCWSWVVACPTSNCGAWFRCPRRCRSPRGWRTCSGSGSGGSRRRRRPLC